MILPMIPDSLTIFRGSILGLPYPFLCPRYESKILSGSYMAKIAV
jgi:hypothetical protein